ncbi:MAG: hypothetical protein JW863_20955 [Chitinispirillaceae bacterium]|nr:hypothetical protein [Chitinispirillaceae bacterium]
MISEHDEKKRRCPMLGHEVSFSYCRAPGSDTPCRKIFDCWWETFDVTSFVNSHYDAAVVGMITTPPTPKTNTLLDLIEQARRRVGE